MVPEQDSEVMKARLGKPLARNVGPGRKVFLKATGIGKGSPLDYGVTSHLVNSGERKASESRRQRDVKSLVQHTVSDPRQWYTWKFYYQDKQNSGGLSGYASTFNMQGESKSKVSIATNKLLKETIKEVGGRFEATYSRVAVDSDDLSKGNFMMLLFVKWVPGE